ncbi:non-heme iron oxygenase ferredoxin subunit [Rubrobacter taiwanensis]|jgi:3-phenylpropionate/trans-cinnamate dioxygenase ferredoxin subunit|uniref:Non-heme iron oxygenase ferredoxin subunit n=1 Tax=Rubrobacter taiwanensis TaxID=185139 RepID=A0A4R1BTD9_9ACTN|nr:non-heme iron oxygenase ferredoxin subunit [Rubrobacter taiwanensis]TCJ20546.1 non-heme iron oxygenase ferredoxin subunit [Rubrobacter taiwanensis]
MSEYHKIARVGDIAPGEVKVYELEGHRVALCNVDGELHAIEDVCTHDAGPLDQGELSGKEIKCPRHGAKFDVTTGRALTLPAVKPVPKHEVKVEDGDVYVALSEAKVTGTRRRRRR